MASLTPPAGRCWFGMYQPPSGTGDPASNTWLNRRMDVVKHYHDWSNSGNNGAFPTATQIAQAAAGYKIHIAWNHGTTYSASLPDYTWAQIAAGQLDAVIDARAAAVASWGAVCWIDFGHEPEFYGSPNSTPTDYVVAYQRIHDRFIAAGATNVVWAWVVASGVQAGSVYQQYYPGDAYVDWIGFDPYNWDDTTWTSRPYDKWVTPYNNFKNGALDGAPTGGTGAKNKPFMLGEYGSESDLTHDRAAWLRQIPDAVRALPNIRCVQYFNNGFGTHPSVILSDAASQVAFNTAGADALFNDRPPGAGFRAGAINQAGTTTPTVTIPAGVQAGDGMLLALHWNHQAGTDTISAGPTGFGAWTQVGTEQMVTFNGTHTASRLYKRVAQAGDASTAVSFTKALGSRWTLQVLAYSGTLSTDPVAAFNVASLAATSPTLATPGVTIPSDCWVVSLVGGRNSTQTTWSTQPSVTEVAYPATTIVAVAGNITALGADSGGLVGAGTLVGRQSATADTNFSSGVMWSVALAPAANTVPDKTGAGVSQGVAAGVKVVGTTAGGVGVPTIVVQVAFGGTTTVDPQAGFLKFDVGPPFDIGQFGNIGWVDVAAGRDVISFSRQLGQSSEIDAAQPGQATIVLDGSSGAYDATNPLSPYFGQIDAGQPVWVKAIWQGQVYSRFRGFIDDIDYDFGFEPRVTLTCSDGLAVLGGTQLDEIAPNFDGDLSGARIGRILDGAGWPGTLRAVDAGFSLCAATTMGDSALSLAEAVVGTELGTHFVSEAGSYTFYDRFHVFRSARSQVVQARFTDVGADVDMASLRVTKGKSTTFNQARITVSGGTEQVANNTASQALYGVRTYPGSVGQLLRTDTDALNMAQWLVTRYATSDLKVTEVRVEAAAQGMWSTLLPLTIDDLIEAIRDYGPNTIDVQVLIVGVGEEIDDTGRWDLTFSTAQPNRVVPFLFDSSKFDTGQISF